MDIDTQRRHAETFRGFHRQGDLLVLFNAWDVASAKAIAKSSPAVATSSGAVAAALGFADGEQVPFDLVAGFVARLTAAVAVPVTIDLEAGYGDTPEAAARSAQRILEAGAIGVNLEDGLAGGERRLVDPVQHAGKIRAVRDAAEAFGVPLFVNARTDPFLLKSGTPEACLDDVVARARIYGEAGADGLFVPGLTDLALIERLVQRSSLPINIMVTTGVPGIADLGRVGVRRVSLGPWPMMAAMRVVGQAAADLMATRTYGSFLKPGT